MIKDLKFHSNFVKSFVPPAAWRKNGTGTISRRKIVSQAMKIETDDFRDQRCIKCRARVETFIQYVAPLIREKGIMIQKAEQVAERLAAIEKKYANLANEHEKVKAENNEFRLIGLTANAAPDSSITDSLSSTHLISVDSWDIETRILFINRLQKHLDIFTISIQKERNKASIKEHQLEVREIEIEKSNKIQSDEARKQAEKIHKDFTKMYNSILKSAQCKVVAQMQKCSLEAAAKEICRQMEIKIPAGF
jgi:hypothetical protein